jgi:hypothetical protein
MLFISGERFKLLAYIYLKLLSMIKISQTMLRPQKEIAWMVGMMSFPSLRTVLFPSGPL